MRSIRDARLHLVKDRKQGGFDSKERGIRSSPGDPEYWFSDLVFEAKVHGVSLFIEALG